MRGTIATKRLALALRESAPGFGFDPAGQGERGKQWLKNVRAISVLIHPSYRDAFELACAGSQEAFERMPKRPEMVATRLPKKWEERCAKVRASLQKSPL